MNILLEERYRRVLRRFLPAYYLAQREEEMVSAFMEVSGDVPDASNPKPRWGEIAAVAGLAIRVRLGATGTEERAVTWGETVRLVALFGLAYQAALGALILASYRGLEGSTPLQIAMTFATGLWIVAYAALIRGRVRVAKVFAVLAAVPEVADYVAQPPSIGDWWLVSVELLWLVPLVALLVGFHRDVQPVVRSWWLVVPPLVVGAASATMYRLLPTEIVNEPMMWLLSLPDLSTVTTVALLIGGVAGVRLRSPSTTLALAILAGTALVGFLSALFPLPSDDSLMMAFWISALVRTLVLAVVTVALAVIGTRLLPSRGNVGVGGTSQLA